MNNLIEMRERIKRMIEAEANDHKEHPHFANGIRRAFRHVDIIFDEAILSNRHQDLQDFVSKQSFLLGQISAMVFQLTQEAKEDNPLIGKLYELKTFINNHTYNLYYKDAT